MIGTCRAASRLLYIAPGLTVTHNEVNRALLSFVSLRLSRLSTVWTGYQRLPSRRLQCREPRRRTGLKFNFLRSRAHLR